MGQDAKESITRKMRAIAGKDASDCGERCERLRYHYI